MFALFSHKRMSLIQCFLHGLLKSTFALVKLLLQTLFLSVESHSVSFLYIVVCQQHILLADLCNFILRKSSHLEFVILSFIQDVYVSCQLSFYQPTDYSFHVACFIISLPFVLQYLCSVLCAAADFAMMLL